MYVLPDGRLSGVDECAGNYGAICGYDDGNGYGSIYDAPYGLSGIFGSIKKAVSGAAKAVGGAVKTVAKDVGKGALAVGKGAVAAGSFAAKNVGTIAPLVVGFIPGVGIPLAAGIAAASKVVSGVARKENVGQIAQETVVGAAEGAAAGAINKAAFGGQGYKGAGRLLGFGKPQLKPGTLDQNGNVISEGAITGPMPSFQRPMITPSVFGSGAGFGRPSPPLLPSGLLPEGGAPVTSLPTPGKRVAKKKGGIGGLLDQLLKGTPAQGAADAITGAVSVPASGGGGGGFSSGGGGSAPGMTDEASAPVQQAGLFGGENTMPLLIAAGIAVVFLSSKGRR